MATETKERKSENILVNAGNLEMDYVISGVEYQLKFQSISDGGSKNQATFKIEGFTHTFTINGVELGQILDKALSQIRIEFASRIRKGSAKEANEANGGKTELKAMFERQPRAARSADPIAAAIKDMDKMSPEEMDAFIENLQNRAKEAKAKQAGISPTVSPE